MDNEFFIGPILSSISSTLGNGEWPLRMDAVLGGVPLYNFPQLSPFYPFYFPMLSIYNSPLEIIFSMHRVTLLHILIMEINIYIFIRVAGASRLSSLTGAALIAFSANSFGYANWMTVVAPYSWFPLYLAGLVGILKYPSSLRYKVIALCGIVLLTLASPAQPLIHAVFVTVVFVSTFWFEQFRVIEFKQLSCTLTSIVLIGLIALLLVAPVIIPTALEFKNMIRWIGPFPAVVGNARIPFEAFQWDQLSIVDLCGVFFKFKSHDVGSQYVGVITIALASVAVVSRPKSWLILALTFIAFYSLISSTGSNLGLAHLNYIIPLLNKIREPTRFLVLFQLAVGVLAALGIDDLRKLASGKEPQVNAKLQIFTMLFVIIIAFIIMFTVRERIVSPISPAISVAILAVIVLITWIVARSNRRGYGTMVALLWSGALLTFLAIEVPWTPPLITNSQYLTSGALALDNAIERVITLDPKRHYRVLFDGKIDKQSAAMLASYRQVRTLNSTFNPVPLRQFEQMYYHGPSADNYFRILGAKYLICDECESKSLQGYRYIESVAGYKIYETQDVLPYSYIVNQLDGEFLNLTDFRTKAATLDLKNGVLFVEPNTNTGLNNIIHNNNDCISQEVIRKKNHSQYVVQCKSAGVLVMNEFFDKAWKTRIDGAKAPALKVNGNQIGVLFGPGTHLIEFRYLPTIFLISFGVAFIVFVSLIYILGFWILKVRNSHNLST